MLSAPAYDEASKKYVGFLDVKDLVSWVVFAEEEKSRDAKRRSSTDKLAVPAADFRNVYDTAARMYNNPESGVTVSYLARRHAFRPVHPDSTLLEVVTTLGSIGVHRVPVVDKATGRVVDIISQSTVIGIVQKNAEKLAGLLGKTVNETQIGSRPVMPVNANDTAIAVFQEMSRRDRSGMAVIDPENGRFLGNTSSSDLKLLLGRIDVATPLLHGTIMEFLSAVRQSEVTDKDRHPAIAISRNDPIRLAVARLAVARIHRVFVADDAHGFKPEAVVSITDVLRYLLNEDVEGSAAAPKINVQNA